MSNKERASLDEVKEFCNKVREAGGAEPLEALLPGVPADSYSCLIARALNFTCRVAASSPPFEASNLRYEDGEVQWFMFVRDEPTRWRIAGAVDLPLVHTRYDEGLLLPRKIGRVVAAYDEWWISFPWHDVTRIAEWKASEFFPLVTEEALRLRLPVL